MAPVSRWLCLPLQVVYVYVLIVVVALNAASPKSGRLLRLRTSRDILSGEEWRGS